MNRTITRRAVLATAPALLLAGCGGSDEETELPLQFVHLNLLGLHDVPQGTYLFHGDAEVADFLARYEYPTQVCDSAGQCVPGHSTPPPVDYRQQAVAGVCAGMSGGCESMTLTRARLRGNTVTLDYQVSRPDPAAGIVCAAVVTWMVAFVLVPASVTQVQAVRV